MILEQFWSYGFGALKFVVYFLSALGLCALFCAAYTRITPHKEFDLIVAQHNSAAAVAFGGALLGYAIALAGAIRVTASIPEFLIWGLISFGAQLLSYWLAAYGHPGLSRAIQDNHMAGAIWTAAASLAAGVITAACMSP